LFLVTKGSLLIRLRDRDLSLGPGELLVVPKGVEHMPVVHEEGELIPSQRTGSPNTGVIGGARAVEPHWI
jgi:mannose-6-phosphate isomerase-like protein (cupin superfamily)